MVNTFQSARESVSATPALVVDLPTVERNVRRLSEYAREHGIGVRPHTKTHKSRRLARLQIEQGAIGLTTAKAGEAEIMAEESRDILVAYPAVDPARARKLAALAQRATIRVAVDTPEGVAALSAAARAAGSTIGILVDLDVGSHRTGVQSPKAALALAQTVAGQAPALRLDGLFFYPGHIWASPPDQRVELQQVETLLAEALSLWRAAGLDAAVVSGGSTPTAYQSHHLPSQTEIRSGTYLFNDMNTVRPGFCALEDCAAAIICTVVSTAVPGKAVLDGGTKTFTSDRNVKFQNSGHGLALEYPDAVIGPLSEEHGEMDLSRCGKTPRVGERVTVIPNHICPCVNLQDAFWLQRADGSLESSPVDTRGLLS